MPPSPGFEGDELPVIVPGGTLEIDGVTITMVHEDNPEFVAGTNHILLAAQCSDRIVRFPHGAHDVFRVESDGRLQAKVGVLPEMQTLQRLRDTLL